MVMRRIAIFSVMVFIILIASSCKTEKKISEDVGSDNTRSSSFDYADYSESADAEESSEVSDSPEVSGEEQDIEIIFKKAILDLSEKGIIYALDSEGKPTFSNGNIFQNDEDKEKFSLDIDLSGKKSIVMCSGTIYSNSGAMGQKGKNTYPHYYPAYTFGNNLLTDMTLPECYADSLDECDYIIYINGFVSRTDKDFYMGNIDRKTVSTLIFIIDKETLETVRIYSAGYDEPGSFVTQSPIGNILYAAAELQVVKLLTDENTGNAYTEEDVISFISTLTSPIAYTLFDINGDGTDELIVEKKPEPDETIPGNYDYVYGVYLYVNGYFRKIDNIIGWNEGEEKTVLADGGDDGYSGIIGVYDDTSINYYFSGSSSLTIANRSLGSSYVPSKLLETVPC